MQSDVPRQLVYGTMVYVRKKIVSGASIALSRAVCIATRYSAVRRQFGSQNGGPETQVLLSFRSYTHIHVISSRLLYTANFYDHF